MSRRHRRDRDFDFDCGCGCGFGFGRGFGFGGCGNGLNICTLLPFLIILGNTGLLENKNAFTLILLFWACCGGFCGKTLCC
ncbi:hypothetical protein [Desnuesiella massiliensis]|uniref:hypothetical protein n=1 Tax=Desnuesiella massiliensis TaxID=1650662 RepID=UPI0006E24A5E|nr:hypothetical protein [Desnuesiella massiliensis]